MRLAYFIQAHHEPECLGRLLRALYNSRDLFLIHIDAKKNIGLFHEVLRSFGSKPNVLFLKPIPVYWGGWSQCQAQINAMRELCRRPERWNYFINLSGQDFPLVSRDEIISFLEADPRLNHIEIRRVEDCPPRLNATLRRRAMFLTLEFAGKARRCPVWLGNTVRKKYRYAGSCWHMLTRDFCEWVIEHGDRGAAFLRLSHCPDEAWIQNLIMDSPFEDTLNPENKRFYIWNGTPHPKVLTQSDFDQISRSGAFFARKFSSTSSGDLFDRIERELLRQPGRRELTPDRMWGKTG
jgi:hypothetical protein